MKAAEEGFKQEFFLREARYLRYYLVNSDLESILLEARLIRLHLPRFNAIARDDKSCLYVEISNSEWPRVKVVRKTDLVKGEDHFGPFMSARQVDGVMRVARGIFRYCSNPGKGRPCFYYHLNLCSGACKRQITSTEFRKTIGYLKRFLNGQTVGILRKWKVDIKKLAKNKQYELASRLRDSYERLYQATQEQTRLGLILEAPPGVDSRLKDLKRLLESVGVMSTVERVEAYDNATMNQTNTVGAMVVFQLGVAVPSEFRYFGIDSRGGDTGAIEEMLERRFEHGDWPTPDLVVVDGGKGQLTAARKVMPKDIPVVALAKRLETLVYWKDGFREMVLPEGGAKKLLQQMRDEVHRFVNSFQAKRARRLLLK